MMGATGFALFNGFYFVAAHTTTAINLGIIQGAIPIFVLLGAFILFRTSITKLQIIGVLVTVIGVLVVTSKGQFQLLLELVFSWGDILMLVACFFYAIYTIGLKYRPTVSAWSLLFAMGVAAFLVSIPMSLAEVSLGYSQSPTTKGWTVIAMITLLPSLLAQAAFIKGVEMIGPERASIFVNLVPIFAAILAVLFLDEDFQLYHAIALIMVLGGISLSEFGKPKKDNDQ
jgi:drug/metabolite transporter (DMT)-like permease